MDEGVGEIIETERNSGKLTFEWRIPNFFRPVEPVTDYYFNYEFGMHVSSQSGEVPGDYTSPPFSFCNECWTLSCERGIAWNPKSGESIELSFLRYKCRPPRTVNYTFAIKALNGVEQRIEGFQEFDKDDEEYGWPDDWLISHLRMHKSRLVPGNVLTIIGTFKSKEPTISLSSRCRNVICNPKSRLDEGNPTDFTLKVGDREWPVHKQILASKSEYFASMFGQEWSENTQGEVKFDDIEEDALDSVLKFIYDGEVIDETVEHLCDIYVTAHKFLLEDLKPLCVLSMKENMGPDTVWKSLAVAKIYDLKDLEKSALWYLNEEEEVKNLCMKDWKQFEQNHPSIAAEVRKEIVDDWDDEYDMDDTEEECD